MADLYAVAQMNTILGEILKFGVWILLTACGVILLYVFAIQAVFVNPVWKTLCYAFVLGSRHIKSTLKLFVIFAVVVLLNQTIVLANFLTLSMGAGIMVYVMSGVWNNIFKRYIP